MTETHALSSQVNGYITSKFARILAILQLCLAFTAVACYTLEPFFGSLYARTVQMGLFENVIGLTKPTSTEIEQSLLKRNHKRFLELPEAKQAAIQQHFQELEAHTQPHFFNQLKQSFHNLFFNAPIYDRAWMFLAIAISIFVLLGTYGAKETAWLLPLLIVFQGISISTHGGKVALSEDERLFPSEELIVRDYLKEPLNSHILEQREQLLRGWNVYLVKEWAHEEPALEEKTFHQQVENGSFAFHLARLELAMHKPVEDLEDMPVHNPPSSAMLLAYLVWNLFFAFGVNKKMSST